MSNVPYSFKSSSNSLTITSDPSICSGFSPIFLNLKHFETLSATVSVLGIPVAADSIFIKSSKCTGVDSTDTINEVIAIITSNASGQFKWDYAVKETCSLGALTGTFDIFFTDSQGRAITFSSGYFLSFDLSENDSSQL